MNPKKPNLMLQRTLLLFFIIIISTSITKGQALTGDDIPPFDYSAPGNYIIQEIKVTGGESYNNKVIIQLTGLEEGQKVEIPGERITKATKKLWDQGLFSDVAIVATKVKDNKIWLNIALQGSPRISKVTYKGIRNSSVESIKEKVSLKPGMQLTENLINDTRYIIKQYFYEKGFYNTSIEFVEEPDSTIVNASRVTINIDKNDKVKIANINIKGNQVLSDWKLRRTLKETKEKNFFRFWKASKYQPEKFEEDKKKLIEAYRKEGFRDAKIISDSVYYVEKDRLAIDIELNEGDRYYFGDIEWVGNTKYNGNQLTRALKIKKGDLYNEILLQKRLSQAQDAVANLYLDNGYLFYQCNPVEVDLKRDTVDLEMRIYEGKQATVKDVDIVGNTKTNEHVVRRELRTKPGQLFSRSNIIRSVRELSQLGFFDPENIVPTPTPHPQDGTVDIEYSVQERSNDQIEISGGWGAGMIIGSIGLRLTNLSIRNFFNKDAWNPVPTGDGETLSIKAQSNGRRYQSYSISFTEPWVGGNRPNSLSVSFYHTLQTNGMPIDNPNRTSMQISGGSVSLNRRLRWPDDYFSLSHSLTYQHYLLNEWNYFLFETGKSNNLSLQTSFSRNSIDNPLYSRNGSSFTLSLQVTPPYSLFNDKNYEQLHAQDAKENIYDWIEYHKWNFKYKWFSQLVGDLVLHTRAEFGYLGYYNDDLGPSPFEGFNVGGDGMTGYNFYGRENIALRGYGNNSLSSSSGDNAYTKYTMELRYPVTLKPSATIYGHLFLEAGNSWTDLNSFNPFKVYRSAGAGVRIFLPMLGLMGIDWGYGFDPIPNKSEDNWGSQFHFVLGREF